jgi:hypothetical protein
MTAFKILFKKSAATLLCAMLVMGVPACVQQQSDPGAGRNDAQRARAEMDRLVDAGELLVYDGESEDSRLIQEYVAARIEMKMLYNLVMADAISREQFDAALKRNLARWKRVEKLADKALRKTSSPVSSLGLRERFLSLLGPRTAWAATGDAAKMKSAQGQFLNTNTKAQAEYKAKQEMAQAMKKDAAFMQQTGISKNTYTQLTDAKKQKIRAQNEQTGRLDTAAAWGQAAKTTEANYRIAQTTGGPMIVAGGVAQAGIVVATTVATGGAVGSVGAGTVTTIAHGSAETLAGVNALLGDPLKMQGELDTLADVADTVDRGVNLFSMGKNVRTIHTIGRNWQGAEQGSQLVVNLLELGTGAVSEVTSNPQTYDVLKMNDKQQQQSPPASGQASNTAPASGQASSTLNQAAQTGAQIGTKAATVAVPRPSSPPVAAAPSARPPAAPPAKPPAAPTGHKITIIQKSTAGGAVR